MGDSTSLVRQHTKATNYLNLYLREVDEYLPNDIHDVKDEHMEGEHLKNFLENFGNWLARTSFLTKQRAPLGNKSKEEYFKTAKEVLKLKFSSHPCFRDAPLWFTDMKHRFDKECKRSSMQNPNVSEERKTQPLYSDLEATSNLNRLIRQKYAGNDIVDLVSVAMHWVKNANEKNSQVLAETMLIYHGVGRGSEHAFLRYSEAAWDPFFEAIDFDWAIIKQLSRKCMLFFCHRDRYCLCPYFALGVFFLFGGLRRETTKETAKDFVFPHLHSLLNDSIAARITSNIRATIQNREHRKYVSSRSIRKGAMGENRVNQNLTIKQEYARSGHTGPEMNNNAEGYIDSIPAMNAPGGKSLAGHKDHNLHVVPHSFECLGTHVVEAVEKLIDNLFVNDIPQLKKGGTLRLLVVTTAARLIGAYKALVRDVGADNSIVSRIKNAARDAKIDDPSVPTTAEGPRWNAVLRDWSCRIEAHVKSKNTEMVPAENASLSQQLSGALSIVHRLEKKVDRMSELMQDRTSDSNSIQLMRENMQLQDANITQLKEENKRLRRQLAASMALSPFSSPLPSKRAADAVLSPARDMLSSTAKRLKTTSSIVTGMPHQEPAAAGPPSISKSSGSILDGIHTTQPLKVGGVTISKELERLWNEGIIQKRKLAAHGVDIEKKILYDRAQHLFVGHHPAFAGNEASSYENGMTVVAIAITKQQWDSILEGSLDGHASRLMFASIEKESLETCLQLEVETGLKGRGKKCSAKAGLHSVGSRFRAIKKKWKELGNSDLEIANMILRRVGDGGGQEQTSIRNYFGGKK
jgi:hypothetical protein